MNQPINAIIEVFSEDNRIKSKTILVPEDVELTKVQKKRLKDAVTEAQRVGRNIWHRQRSSFKLRQEYTIK